MNLSNGYKYYDRCLLIWVIDMNAMIGSYKYEK